MDVFQKTRNKCTNIFDIPYYKLLEKYMKFLGQDPRQRDGFRNIIVIAMVTSISGILIPTSLELYTSLCDKNMDAVIECLPHLIAAATSVVKLLNIHFNRENFKKLFEFITKEWEKFELNNQFHVLEEITIKGSKMAQLYRNTLLSFMVLFLLVPLIFPLLDIVHPLNETRSRQQLFRVNYLIFNHNDYFFYIYLQLAWGSVIVVMIIVTIDSLYMIIIHHSSGMFAMCGYKVQEATRYPNLFNDRIISENYTYEQLKNCITTHDKAIQFYNILNESSRNSYLIQVGLNMMGISVTAVQTVVNLDRPEEAIRTAVFLGAEQFHLFVISLPGQVLLDHCTELANNIYSSTWYGIPVKIQKVLHMMQIRSKKPCSLTAGGLYEMNMENFGITFKTCMSYFTMLMSLKK
ncbi:putative odorant receptor 71a isoform X2 [Apis florea]|uniref:putative odorant receptor 71a isoform X2 n=1 Tax=Apis florea TaxID=7463 RepID=UPI0012FEC0DA|nr:putative odorant receptor 71a isoform X2 [Apis florea]